MNGSAGLSIVPILAWFAVVLACAAVWWFGRGRRVACPPSCGACGYDVSQRPSESERCSECGADLAGAGAIVTSRRTRPRWIGVTFGTLLLLSAFSLGLTAYRFPWENWYFTNAPTEWVMKRACSAPRSARARDEWMARFRAGRLSPAEQAALYDHLLDWQDDFSRAWDQRSGDLLWNALQNGQLTPAQAERFCRGAFGDVQFRTRKQIRVGDVVPFEYRTAFRGGTTGSWAVKEGCFASFTGPPVAPPKGYGWGWGSYDGHQRVWTSRPQDVGSDKLAPGVHTLHLLLVAHLSQARNSGTPLTPGVEFRKAIDVEVLPAGAPLGRPVRDAASADAVARGMQVGIFHWPGGRIFAEVSLRPAPVDRAFDVYVEHNGRAIWIARRHAKAGESSTFHSSVEYVPIPDSPELKTLTLVFVGSGDALAGSIDQETYWSGNVIFRDVLLRPQADNFKGPVPLPKYEVEP